MSSWNRRRAASATAATPPPRRAPESLPVSRYRPIASKCSKPKPIGSISRWHDAHVGFSTCSTINCRRPLAGFRSTSGSGSVVMTPGGGGGTCWQSSRSRMKMPRAVGDVSVGPAVEARNVPCPRMPARGSVCGELHHLELILRRGHAVDLRELRRQEAVISRQRFHEVAIVPHQVMQQRARLFRHCERKLRRERLIAPPTSPR